MSIPLVRALRPVLVGSAVSHTLLLAQFSARPWALSREVVLPDLFGWPTRRPPARRSTR